MEKLAKQKIMFEENLADNWPSFVDCKKRLLTETPFLLGVLNDYKSGVILDAALGMGCESIFLIEMGFDVISNERDAGLLKIAMESASEKQVTLKTTAHDWCSIARELGAGSANAVVLLGNSICLVKGPGRIKECLFQFYELLKPGGCIIIDERNFPYIHAARNEILGGHFRYSQRYVYCGSRVTGRPIIIDADSIRFGYFRNDTLLGTLDMYPFGPGELKNLLTETGFTDIKTYSDFKEEVNAEADYFTYAAYKA